MEEIQSLVLDASSKGKYKVEIDENLFFSSEAFLRLILRGYTTKWGKGKCFVSWKEPKRIACSCCEKSLCCEKGIWGNFPDAFETKGTIKYFIK